MLHITKDHLPWAPKTFLWQCPECGTINAWNFEDAERAAAKLKKPVEVCYGSCFDNFCGSCKADIVKPDSPILAQCYSHIGE